MCSEMRTAAIAVVRGAGHVRYLLEARWHHAARIRDALDTAADRQVVLAVLRDDLCSRNKHEIFTVTAHWYNLRYGLPSGALDGTDRDGELYG